MEYGDLFRRRLAGFGRYFVDLQTDTDDDRQHLRQNLPISVACIVLHHAAQGAQLLLLFPQY